MSFVRAAVAITAVCGFAIFLACASGPQARATSNSLKAHLSVLGVHPNPAARERPTEDVTVFVSFSISRFDESLAPYTVSLQFQTAEGMTVGPAFGPSNAVVSAPSGQVRLVVSLDEVFKAAPPQHLASPLTMIVIVDHATADGTRIIGRSRPIAFGFPVGA
jgi:hypothetical protein